VLKGVFMNAIGIGNYGMITGNYTRSTDMEQKQTSTSFADVVQNKLDTLRSLLLRRDERENSRL